MKTSWSARSNYWGWSWMSDVDNALSDYTAWVNTTYGASYTATSWNEDWFGGFSWDDFKAEIDANQPMVFLVDSSGDGGTDHFVTAIGYRETLGYPEYASLDTWTTTGYRWERFRQMSANYSWGVYGATYFHIIPEPSGLMLATLGLFGLVAYSWRRRK